MTEVICTDTGAGRGRGKSESQEKKEFLEQRGPLRSRAERSRALQQQSLAVLGLKGLLLVFRVSCVIFKMCFFEWITNWIIPKVVLEC